jgi:hypothetical protein
MTERYSPARTTVVTADVRNPAEILSDPGVTN